MLNKILCATDLSRGADDVLAIAAGLARAFRTSLQVLHVVEPPSGDAGDEIVGEATTRREAAEQALRARLASMAEVGVPVSGWVELGRADEVILSVATAGQPALLVLGSHGRGSLVRMLIGSVAERILRKAPCPLLIIPPAAAQPLRRWSESDHTEPLRIAVGFDDSPAASALLGWIRELRRTVPSDLTFLHAFWPPQESRRLGLPVCTSGDDCDGEVAQIIEREVRTALGTMGGEEAVKVTVAPCWGEVSDLIAEQASRGRADVLLLGTSVGGGATTAISLLRAGGTPVLCVPALEAKTGVTTASSGLPSPGKGATASVAVFTDLSSTGETAVAEGAWLLHGRGLLTICHVDAPCTDATAALDRAAVRVRLDALAAKAGLHPGIRVQTLVHESPTVAEGILQAIGRIGPDMVVMSSRGIERESALVRGSVAEVVVRHARVPVVIVPPRGPAREERTPVLQATRGPHI
ncbi:MAG TPA: universal stress protein [Polyangia bacterium]